MSSWSASAACVTALESELQISIKALHRRFSEGKQIFRSMEGIEAEMDPATELEELEKSNDLLGKENQLLEAYLQVSTQKKGTRGIS
jgi:hypothetical protein